VGELTYVAVGAVGAVLVLGGVLYLLGRATVIGPGRRGRADAWAQVLLGVSIGLFELSRVPDHHRLVRDAWLLPPGLGCLVLAAVLFLRASRR
jgi:hypothetical protein